MYLENKSIRLLQDILRKNVVERPEKVALICENRRLTYAQIDEMSNRLANAFRQNGVKDGDRIVFYLLNSVELIVSIFAALKAQAIFSVVDYANTIETLHHIVADCEATVLVTNKQQLEATKYLSGEVPSLRFAIIVDLDPISSSPNLLAFDAILKDYSPDALPQRMIDRDLAYLLYTSGSTGQSKGVLTTHQSVLFTIESGAERFLLTEDDIHTIPLPLSFAPGMNQFLQTFRIGGTLILEKSFAYPALTLKRMATERATGIGCVPTTLALLLQMDLSRYDLSHLRYMISSGAALAPSIIQHIRQKLPQTVLYSMYGMAEASFILCLEPGALDQRPASVGTPFPGTQAWIVDDDDRKLGPNQIGELVVRGGHVRNGYWNDPETSARRFRPGPLPGELVCYTGDMFYMDEDGYYYFVSRSDEIIKSGAKKIAPREIENALYTLTGVLEAAAIGIPDPVMGQVIKAFVVPTQQAQETLTVQDVLKRCRQTLEAYKVPREIEIRASLPKTTSGKIKKTDLA